MKTTVRLTPDKNIGARLDITIDLDQVLQVDRLPKSEKHRNVAVYQRHDDGRTEFLFNVTPERLKEVPFQCSNWYSQVKEWSGVGA